MEMGIDFNLLQSFIVVCNMFDGIEIKAGIKLSVHSGKKILGETGCDAGPVIIGSF